MSFPSSMLLRAFTTHCMEASPPFTGFAERKFILYLLVIRYIQFVTHHVVLMVIIVEIDNAEAAIRCRHLQRIDQVPSWPSKVIRCAVQNETVTCPVKLVEAATDATVIANQQILMLIDHSQPQEAVHRYDKLR